MPKPTFFNIPEEKRNHFLQVAVAEFTNHTYDEVSIRRIVAEAGISIGSFYRYFDTKDELYIYLVDYLFDEYEFKKKALLREHGRPLNTEEILSLDERQRRFWEQFNQSSLDIRKKYYFRTKGNRLYERLFEDIQAMETKRIYSETEKKMMTFIISVLQYVVIEYKNLEGYDYPDDDFAFRVFKKILLTGFLKDE